MSRFLYVFGVLFLFTACEDPYVYAPPSGIERPKDIFGGMYEEILSLDTLGISKQIADGFPKSEIKDIKLAFRKQKNNSDFDLQKFISEHWQLATPRKINFVTDQSKSISDFSSELWSALSFNSSNQPQYSSLIELPHPYIPINGAQLEMRYMDSYFIMVGLAAEGKWNMVSDMVDNFAFLIDKIGHIPETNRTYMTSRSNQPFFSHMVELLATHEGESVYSEYISQLKKEHDYWIKEDAEIAEHNGIGHTIKIGDKLLTRYNDPSDNPRDEKFLSDKREGNHLYRVNRSNSESGWQRSSRWLGDNKRTWSTFSRQVSSIDLNSLLFHLENTLIKAYNLLGKDDQINEIQSKRDVRKLSLDSLHWDSKKKIFEDVNYKKQARTGKATLAMLYPLFTKMCSQEQADGVAEFVERTLLKDGGLMDTDDFSNYEWDAPNAHAPLQYIAVKGLDNYGHKDLAKKIAVRYLNTIENTFTATGRITEMYNLSETDPEKMAGAYQGKDAYSWTLGVYSGLKQYLE